MAIRKPLDFVTGLVLFSGALFMFVESFKISQIQQIALGPTFFPRLLLGAILVLSFCMILQSFRGSEKTSAKGVGGMNHEGALLQGGFIGALLLYILCLPIAGYALCTFLFCFATMCLLGARSAKRVALYAGASAVTALGLEYVFGTLLNLFLP